MLNIIDLYRFSIALFIYLLFCFANMGVCNFMSQLLTVGCWNIGRLYENINGVKNPKFEDETFRNTLKSFDILCLQETHIGEDLNVKIKNFHTITHCRQKSVNNRYFGVILVVSCVQCNVRSISPISISV